MFCQPMKRQGYRYVMPISYGNGDTLFRWSVRFYPETPGNRSSNRVDVTIVYM